MLGPHEAPKLNLIIPDEGDYIIYRDNIMGRVKEIANIDPKSVLTVYIMENGDRVINNGSFRRATPVEIAKYRCDCES